MSTLRKSLIMASLMVLVAGTAGATVVGTAHDLSAGSGHNETGEKEVCVFCHTPHGSAQGAPVPLWNKVLSTGTYIRYSSLLLPSFDSTELVAPRTRS